MKKVSVEMEVSQPSNELRQELNDTNNSSSNSEKLIYEPIEDTPFAVVELQKGHAVILGSYVLSIHNEKKEAIETAKDINWMRIMQVISIVVDAHIKEQKGGQQ